MRALSVSAPAKLNWSLSVTGIRSDGYHELDMLMQTVSLCDSIEIEKSARTRLYVNGAPDSFPERNLVYRALRAVSEYTGRVLEAEINLVKRVPARAGLGGGSSDCASTLMALNELYELGLSQETLKRLALPLGADVPFFIHGGFCRVEGIGEKVTPLDKCPKAHIVIKQAGSGLSTPAVYAKYDELTPGAFSKPAAGLESALTCGDFALAGQLMRNDLQPAAEALEPEITKLLALFNELDAQAALMTGSGSAVYGVFDNEKAAQSAADKLEGAVYCVTL